MSETVVGVPLGIDQNTKISPDVPEDVVKELHRLARRSGDIVLQIDTAKRLLESDTFYTSVKQNPKTLKTNFDTVCEHTLRKSNESGLEGLIGEEQEKAE
jgi:hypothetical protein